MLSFKHHQGIFRFTERLSFKKPRDNDEHEDEKYIDVEVFEVNAVSPFYSEQEIYEQVHRKRFARRRPTIPFSEYMSGSNKGGPARTGKHSKQVGVDLHNAVQYHYRHDGLIDHQAMAAAELAKKQGHSSPRSQFSFLSAIEETFEQIKVNRTNEKNEKRKNARFPGAGKVNAEVKIQFDGDRYIYKV
ncbi:hypothetical protein P389DRAFT_110522 [Cystobasidium minutum MCA 4210]|uniref:uncharacterized protein n=1 Tax=Cystobasidium minutum MCA 4210 TaxID=1397322 RepID=UPI0034CF35D6|eukprot:jgi/Rhomi1/110522/CE110521_220